MIFLYDLPNWLLGIVVIGVILVLSFAGYFLFHRLFKPAFTEDNKTVALVVLTVIATINSLLLAFSAISVWEAFGAADAAVVQEANTIGELGRDLAVYDSPEAREARRMLLDYTEKVVSVEWADMQRGQSNIDVWNRFDRMFLQMGKLEPDTPKRTVLLPEIWARTNELVKARRSRIYTSESEVPGTLWTVVLLGAAITMIATYVLPPTRFHGWMVGLLALSFGLVFFLIIAMDRPFAGKESISPEPFTLAIMNMQRWDAVIQPK